MITITADFSMEQLEKDMEARLQVWFNKIAKKLMDTGKSITDNAISKAKTGSFSGGGFGNITFDLRSSMGCGLVIGKMVKETYFPFKATNSGKENGLSLLNTVASEVDEEIAVVFVAGEKYAVFVEQKGYDVITMSFATFDPAFMREVANA